jgi:uncharacterized protein (DUF885 family)
MARWASGRTGPQGRAVENAVTADADRQFAALAAGYLDDRAQRHPESATAIGDHRFDAWLGDDSAAALADERQALERYAARLAALDTGALAPEHRVDAAMLGGAVDLRRFQLDELREHTWNPLLANPGRAVYQLLARDFAPLPDRLAAVAGRLAAIPARLAAARAQLGAMPRVHLETAISQLGGTMAMIGAAVDEALAAAPGAAAQLGRVRPAALAALAGHQDWLSGRLAQSAADGSFAGPRLGAERYARKLSLTLAAAADADAILARAQADLDQVSEQIAELAARLAGPAATAGPRGSRAAAAAGGAGDPLVRQVLGALGADAADDTTILPFCRQALVAATAFARDAGLVTLYSDPVEVIEMPELDRGVAVAYCDSPGPLEPPSMPTFLAVSPTPAGWPAERVASFYREYNQHMVHNLIIHEAMPGHYLQLQHSRRFTGSATAVRAALRSGSFVEGWAVYAERLMAEHEYPGGGDPRAVRMQQLKMQLRTIINAILDARVHGHGMTQEQAMTLMTGRGYQEEGEAAGKWRRVLLTSAQLSTYYVGYTEVSDLAADLAAAGGSERAVHDRMLGHGSPPAALLRTLLAG